MFQIDKALPHSGLDEQQVLGACMCDASAMREVAETMLAPEHFYSTEHTEIFTAILAVYHSSEYVNTVSVYNQNTNISAAYLAQLQRETVSVGGMAKYAKMIKAAAHDRNLLNSFTRGIQDIQGGTSSATVVEAILSASQNSESETQDTPAKLVDITSPAIAGIEARMKTGGIVGIPTGFTDLDILLSGLHKGELVTIAARTSAGKSSLARQIAVNVGLAGNTVAIFSLEMSASLIAELMLCMRAEINLHELQKGIGSGSEQIEKLVYAAQTLQSASVYIDATASRVEQVCSRSRKLASRRGLDLIIIDYLQLIEGEKGQSREREVASVSRALKLLASELNVAVIALSQLNRRVDFRQGGPRLSDLRESGAIEQDSDVVIFLERVNMTKEPNALGNVRLTVKKQRSGPIGIVWLTFRKEYTRFENAAR